MDPNSGFRMGCITDLMALLKFTQMVLNTGTIWVDGSKPWYQNDILHRTDGPAIECPGGINSWWLNGKILTEQEYNERIKSI